MASIANTAFEVKVTNIQRNNTQNVAGKFGVIPEGGTFTAEACPAGFLCAQYALLPNEGYETLGPNGSAILNGNSWQMITVGDGTDAHLGDHTGIYAFNSYDVPKATNNLGNVWNLGANLLGQELPAGEIGTFTEIIVGEQYKFGAGNFSTAPSAGAIYATIANGRLVASSTPPENDSGLYFKILRQEGFTVGARYAGFDGYICQAARI